MASPLYRELSVAKRRQLNFCSMQARALLRCKQEIWCWSRIGRSKRGTGEIPVASGMSALGQKPTSAPQKAMSALLSKADMCSATRRVCFGPLAEGVTHCVAANELPDYALLIRLTVSLDI